jgi:proline iminopeptidase
VRNDHGAMTRGRLLRRIALTVLAAVAASALAAGTMIGISALTGSLGWAVVGAVLAAFLTSWLFGFLIWGRSRNANVTPLRRVVLGPMLVFVCAAVLSLTWLYPGSGASPPDSISGIEWLNSPDGSRLAVHITRAPAPTQPPITFVHGGPGVADMAHDAPRICRPCHRP